MSFEVGQFLGSLFGADEAVSLAVADPSQPDAPASVDAVVVRHVEYRGDIMTDDDLYDADIVFDEAIDMDDLWPGDNAVDLPPCKSCGGLKLWGSMAGNWRCCECDPPTKAQRCLEKAGRLRSGGS